MRSLPHLTNGQLKTVRSAGANSLAPTACSKARRSEALGNEGGLGGSPDQEAMIIASGPLARLRAIH
jgi:hypothetical protein